MKLRTAGAGALAALLLAIGQTMPAEAVTYRWATTDVDYGSLKVRWCSGGTDTIRGRTTRDVCGFFLAYNREVYVYVAQTGTELYETAYCGSGSGRWVTFTSRTDTSRTAVATVTPAQCA